MKNAVLKAVSLILICGWMSGCMPYQSMQAPCDQYAIDCGQKIKINQW